MRERASRVDCDEEQYHAGEVLHSLTSKKKLEMFKYNLIRYNLDYLSFQFSPIYAF